MLNSLLMLGSTYNKSKRINIVFAISWIAFMLMGSDLKNGLVFTVMNIMAFTLVFGLGRLVKGKYSNKIVAVSSILIWSVLIDSIAYFLYPQFTIGQTIFGYIGSGIIFNYKYVFYNALIVGALLLAEHTIKFKIASKEKLVTN